MRDGTRDFDTEQTGDTEQETEHASDEGAPQEYGTIPFWRARELQNIHDLSIEEHEWGQECSRAQIGPVCELNGGVIAVGKRCLDQNSVDSYEE